MNTPTINVLFLLMEFAPVNTTGNFRSLKFIKYLRSFGVEPIVVTFLEKEGAKYFNTSIDPGLLKDIPPDLSIYRIHCEDGDKYYSNRLRSFITIYFSIKDNLASRWKRTLLPELEKIIQKHQPAIIFTSLPPFSAGSLAVDIAKRYNLPLVVDMRDLYAKWGNTPFGSILHYWLTLREERRILRGSKAIIGVTNQLVSIFRQSHPSIPPQNFHYIPNGFDVEVTQLKNVRLPAHQPKIVIGYVGSFYYQPEARDQMMVPWWKRAGHKKFFYSPTKEDWLYRSPYFFLKTMAALFEKWPHFRDIVRIEFVGKNPAWLAKMIEKFELTPYVTSHGFVDFEQSQKIQQHFDLFLATSEKVEDAEHYCLPSKIFDYVDKGKPILGFVTNGSQREFIEKSNLGVICDPDAVDDSAGLIQRLLSEGFERAINREYLADFQRKKCAEKLSHLFYSLEGNRSQVKAITT